MYNNQQGIATYKDLLNYLTDAQERMHTATKEEQIQIIQDIYARCKIDAITLFECGKKSYYFTNILDIISDCEDYLRHIYIVPCQEIYKNPGRFSKLESSNEVLDYIVYQVRNRIVNDYIKRQFSLTTPYPSIMEDINLDEECPKLSKWVEEECQKIGVKCRIVRIDPAFNRKKSILNGFGYHYFCLVELENKRYLIDLSYKQFFKQHKNIFERTGVVGKISCLPGAYMLLEEDRKNLATTLIEKGWIEFNEDTIKQYFDGFAISFRNGIYYELLGRVDYSTTYTSNDYLNFLDKKDDMLKHEPREGLGRQMKPLKNPYMKFRIK